MLDDQQHLAEMVSLMGPPPRNFLERSEKCRKYWDDDGKADPGLPAKLPKTSGLTRRQVIGLHLRQLPSSPLKCESTA